MKTQSLNEFLNRLAKLDDDEVMQMRGPVQEMARSEGFKIIESLVSQRIAEMRAMMEIGLKEHAEYTAFIGELRGMQVMQSAIDAVLTGSERAAKEAAQTAALEEAHGH